MSKKSASPLFCKMKFQHAIIVGAIRLLLVYFCFTKIGYSATQTVAPQPPQNFVLTEKHLSTLIRDTSPDQLRISAQTLRSQVGLREFSEQFSWNWTAQAEHEKSNEQAIAQFIPVFGPTYIFATGVKKRLPYGATIAAQAFTDQRSTTDRFIDEATRSGLRIQTEVDLWQNLFGAMDQRELKRLRSQKHYSEIEGEWLKRRAELNARKLFWSWQANRESTRITDELKKTAQQQLNVARARQRKSVADQGEVARYEAQLASRESTISQLLYEKDQIERSFKNLAPQLLGLKLENPELDSGQTMTQVFACIQRIEASTAVAWQDTLLDDMAQELKNSLKLERELAERYDSSQLLATGDFQQSGVGQGFNNSFENYTEKGRFGYRIGLTLKVPLDERAETAEIKKALIEKERQAQIDSHLAQVHSFKEQSIAMIAQLRRAQAAQAKTSQYLRQSLQITRRKYQQARVSENELITEQDSFLQSQISEVQIRLAVINVLLDYFMVFTQDSCPFNQLLTQTSEV